MKTFQKVSALKAPLIISSLRQQLKTVKNELRELKKDNEKRFNAMRKICRQVDLSKYINEAEDYESNRAAYKIYQNTNGEVSLRPGLRYEDIDTIRTFHKEIAARKAKQIRKLFDFRKNQNKDEIRTKANQIIHSQNI